MKIKQNLFLLLVAMLLTIIISRDTFALFNDFEQSGDSNISAWVSQKWIQTEQADFNAGVAGASYNTDTATYPGDVILNLVSNQTIVTSDNNVVSTSPGGYQLMKILTFTKTDTTYNTLRIDSNLRTESNAYTVYSSIRVDGVEKFTHTYTATTYINYSDTLDFSGYTNAEHTITLWLRVANPGEVGYNNKFEVYRVTPTLVTSDNSTVSKTGTSYVLKKTLNFTKSGSAYNSIRLDYNLKSSSTSRTAYVQIYVDNVLKSTFSKSTTSTSYQSYAVTFDFSSYADGAHTIKLYLKSSYSSSTAYNSKLELYRMADLITSDNNLATVTDSGANWELVKTLNYTQNGRTYNELLIKTTLKASSPATAYIRVDVDDVQKFTYSTTSSSYYVNYSDILVLSLLDGQHTVKLYLKTSNKNNPAYNNKLEIYRTRTYAASGTAASRVFDTSTVNSRWDGLGWAETLAPSSDITFEVRASDTAFLKTDEYPAVPTAPQWIAVLGNSIIENDLPRGQYKQWRATLTSTDVTRETTPTLSEVTTYYQYRP